MVAGFELTRSLLEPLRAGAPARVINVSSGGMYTQRLRADDLQSEQGEFDGAAVYARTKRAEVVLTELWAQRLDPAQITVHAMHPGWADTPGVKSSLPRFYRATKPLLRTPAQGADTIVWLGAAGLPGRETGGLLARPPPAADSSAPLHARDARGSRASLGGVRAARRRRLSDRAPATNRSGWCQPLVAFASWASTNVRFGAETTITRWPLVSEDRLEALRLSRTLALDGIVSVTVL